MKNLSTAEVETLLRKAEHVLMRVQEFQIDGESPFPAHIRAGILETRELLGNALELPEIH